MSDSAFTSVNPSVVILGAGTGGMAVAACLRNARTDLDITVVDPASFHHYQAAWSLVGAGIVRPQDTRKTLQDCLPAGVHHVAQAATTLRPDDQQVGLADGTWLNYDYLVVAAGLQLNWHAVDGLVEALGKGGVTSTYRDDLASYTWDLIRGSKGGTAVFTRPSGVVKAPGAAQKALYLAADHFRRVGVHAELQFRSAGESIFGIPFYARALDRVMASYGAQAHYGQNLVQVRAGEHIAVFESRARGRLVREEVHYDLLHVVPPQSAPDFIRDSSLADEAGWLEVDRHTLRHVCHANVFGLGDCTSTPNSKTAAAVKSQVPVVVGNLLQALRGRDSRESYDGYAACPLRISRDKAMLVESTYGGVVTPSFALDPRVPRHFYGWLERTFLPWFYWNILIKGRGVPVTYRARRFPSEVPPLAGVGRRWLSPLWHRVAGRALALASDRMTPLLRTAPDQQRERDRE